MSAPSHALIAMFYFIVWNAQLGISWRRGSADLQPTVFYTKTVIWMFAKFSVTVDARRVCKMKKIV